MTTYTLTAEQMQYVLDARANPDPTDVIVRVWETLLGHHPKDHPTQIRPSDYKIPEYQVTHILESVNTALPFEARSEFLLTWMNVGPSVDRTCVGAIDD